MNIVLTESLGIPDELLSAYVSPLRASGHRFATYGRTTDLAALRDEIRDADAILLANMPLPGEALRACGHLQFVDIAFTGVDHVDVAAARALGAVFFGRFDPQLHSERQTLARAGIDTRRWYGLEELVRAPQTLFLATGIRPGWLGGVERGPGWLRTTSFVLTGPGGERARLARVRPWREALHVE